MVIDHLIRFRIDNKPGDKAQVYPRYSGYATRVELRYTEKPGERAVNIGAYRQALEKYVTEAVQNSDGTQSGISSYLWNIKIPRLSLNRYERQRALDDARHAFDDHRHWPVDVILSHLGLKAQKQTTNRAG